MNAQEDLKISKALSHLVENFPIPGYLSGNPFKLASHLTIAKSVISLLPVGSKVLDFGAGPGDKSILLQDLGFTCTAVDDLKDEWHAEYKEKILNANSSAGVRYYLDEEFFLKRKSMDFDLIMLNDVLEHIHDSPRELLQELLETLNPGGYLLITVPNAGNLRKRIHLLFGKTNLPDFRIYWWYPGKFRGHVREYVRGDLKALSEFLNLDLIKLQGSSHMLSVLSKPQRQVFGLMSKMFPNIKDSWLLIARKPADWKGPLELTEKEVHEIIRGFDSH